MSNKTQIIRRGSISALLLALVAIVATAAHLYLHREAWIAQGESATLWDWTDAMWHLRVPFAAAQYVAVVTAFALAWMIWNTQWRLFRNILIAWGITWLPMAITATDDVTASFGGPFNFPLCMFAAPIFAFFCVVELVIALIIYAAIIAHRCEAKPSAKQPEEQKASTPRQD